MPPRMYLFRDGENFYMLTVDDDLKKNVYKMTLPDSGFGRAALPTSVDDCPSEVAAFFAAMVDGEKLRDEFAKRGAY